MPPGSTYTLPLYSLHPAEVIRDKIKARFDPYTEPGIKIQTVIVL